MKKGDIFGIFDLVKIVEVGLDNIVMIIVINIVDFVDVILLVKEGVVIIGDMIIDVKWGLKVGIIILIFVFEIEIIDRKKDDKVIW